MGKRYVVTYGLCFGDEREGLAEYRKMDYPIACDRLQEHLDSSLNGVLPEAQFVEDLRDGECLSLRFSFTVAGSGPFPEMPKVPPFDVLEVVPYDKVY